MACSWSCRVKTEGAACVPEEGGNQYPGWVVWVGGLISTEWDSVPGIDLTGIPKRHEMAMWACGREGQEE